MAKSKKVSIKLSKAVNNDAKPVYQLIQGLRANSPATKG
jgi:hypothetical protein